MLTDLYADFAALSRCEREGIDFRIRSRRRGSAVAVIAPHGGGIEEGTSEIADAAAGDDLSFYAFEGIKPSGNAVLHITSPRFDEPTCLEIVAGADHVVAIHGERSEDPVVYVGGLDVGSGERLARALAERRFEVRPHPRLRGDQPSNVCNRGRSGAGVQLEIARGLRRAFFLSLRASGRRTRHPRFHEFVEALREGLVS